MGLIGYVNDETQRRSKDIAIRKVNGAEASTILRDVYKRQSLCFDCSGESSRLSASSSSLVLALFSP